MDPFSIATGSIALVSTITKVGISLTGFVREVRDSRSDIDGVSADLSSLKTILELIVDDVEAAKSPLPPLLKTRIEGILSSCSQAVNDIDACVKCHQGSRVQKGMRWATIGKGEMSKLQSTLEANKATLSLALDMISITTLQEVKQTTAEIQNTTTNIYQDTGDIKEDTARILQAIVELQARLPPEENPRYNMLQRYLDELSTYAESVIDEMDRNLNVDESSSEASTPRGPSPNSSFTTFIESQHNGQLIRRKALPPTNDPGVQNSMDAQLSSHPNPPQDRRSPSREFQHQGSSTLKNVQSTDITSDENASHTTQRQSLRNPDSAVRTRDTQEPPKSPTSRGDGIETEMDRIRARAKQILQESRQQQQQQEAEPMTSSSLEDLESRVPNFSRNFQLQIGDNINQHDISGCETSGGFISPAQRLEEITGVPQHSLSRDQRSYIWIDREHGNRCHWLSFPVPTALLDCAAYVESLWDNYTMYPHVLEYTFRKCDTSTPKTSDCDKRVIATELSKLSQRGEVSANEVEVVCSMIAVLGYLDGLADPILPPTYIVEPKVPWFRLDNSIPDKDRRKAARMTLRSLPKSDFGILAVVLCMFAKCNCDGIFITPETLTKKILRSDKESHREFVLDLFGTSFRLSNYHYTSWQTPDVKSMMQRNNAEKDNSNEYDSRTV